MGIFSGFRPVPRPTPVVVTPPPVTTEHDVSVNNAGLAFLDPGPVILKIWGNLDTVTETATGLITATITGVGNDITLHGKSIVTDYGGGLNPNHITVDNGDVSILGGGDTIFDANGNVTLANADHTTITALHGVVNLANGSNEDVTLGAGSSLNSHANNVTAHVGIGDVDPLNFFGGTGEKVVFSGAVHDQHGQRGFLDNFNFGPPAVEVVQGFQGVLDFSQLTHDYGQVLKVTETVKDGNLFVHLFSADDHNDHHDHHQADAIGHGSSSSSDGFTVELVGVTHTTVVGATVVQDHSHVWFG